MKHSLICILLFFVFSSQAKAQNFSELWEGHFSYLNIKDIVQGNNKVFAASENAVFVYDVETNQLKKISTVHGLSGEFISSLFYSEAYELLLIGYDNGLIDVYQESTEEILHVVDILEKTTIPPDNKKVNHFNAYENLIYIATDYGISIYDLERLEFGDTYYIGDGGSQIIVSQTTVFGTYIYAACLSNNGIKRALVASNDLINYQEWTQISGGNALGIEAVEDKLYATKTDSQIYSVNGAVLNSLFSYPKLPLDLKASVDKLVVTTEDKTYIYNKDFNLLSTSSVVNEFDTKFTSATTTIEGIYIGTKNFGVLKSTTVSPSIYTEIHPEGPIRNNTFSLEAGFGQLWVSYGDYSISYNPNPQRTYGISHLKNEEWNNTPYDSLFGARNLNAISIHPFNPSKTYVSSFQNGIVAFNSGQPEIKFDQTNSGLESLIVPNDPNAVSIRVSGSNFDSNGLLWSMTALIQRPLKSYDPATGQWQSYDFSDIITDPIRDEFGYSDVLIDNSGTKWIGGYKLGVIAFNENGNQLKYINDEALADLPSAVVKAIALDNRNQLWIGTIRGLRVLYNTGNFFEDENVSTFPIIILEDGIPKELLEQQYISDIKVDGSNNKWVSTIGAGLFYFSSDGQETIYHFTKDNSPLPSNNINDLSIDNQNGVIYIGTDKGLLAFKSGGSESSDNLGNAFIYPNPVRPEFDTEGKKIKIKDISDNVNIKITDIEGNLVAEAETGTNLRYRGYNLEIDGGTAYWNGKNLINNKVASGVYLVLLSDFDTQETKVLKLMIIR
ncbi:MAG: ABC transporter substrate-binding protein [Flavobacteriaceae bacterium]|nr:ABC transporter substrate-binding protein [Flavobacteriaceae bacterium]